MAFFREKTQKLLFKVDSLLNFRKWFMYGLKAQKLIAQGIARKQHALKGQKLLAQGKRTQAARPEGAKALNPGLKDTSSTP